MKELFFKAGPVVIGILLGWLIVSPPEFLGLPAVIRFSLIVPLAALVLLVFFIFLISASMPAGVQLTPIDQRNVTEGMFDLFNAYRDAGFELAGLPLKVGINPPAVLVPLIDPKSQIYGTIYRTGTVPAKTACDIVSIFDPVGGLTTGSLPEGASLPAGPGIFYQVFPGADIRTLRDKHLEALAYLQRQGVRVKPGSAEDFAEDFKRAVTAMRRHFFTNPIWHTLVTVWRASTRSTPHIGPVQRQAVAQKTLRRLQEWTV